MTFWDTEGKLYNSLQPLHCTESESLAYHLGWKTRIITPVSPVPDHVSDGIPYTETDSGLKPIPAPTLGPRSCYYLEEPFKLLRPIEVKDYGKRVGISARIAYQHDDQHTSLTVNSGKVHDSIDFPVNEWLPGSQLPKWLARKYFIVTSLRMERLQDITEIEARESGVKRYAGGYYYRDYRKNESSAEYLISALDSFRSLHGILHGWEPNQLVWSIGLRCLDCTDRRVRVL